ncbi:MAG: secondary thiamine-phosphate synthase enzyme YjbQ [Calditrichia bacterium]|jgi:secondary thiamine-phosphate synthase enzyme|nr:secondary thiamine-phosphate synthase enzyme YjbQ [Calditrichia bacterium]
MENFTIHSTDRTSIIDITQQIQSIVKESGIKDGVCYVFIPHTTAGVTINENADPDVKSDMLMEINKVIPFSDSYRHIEGNSAAHIKASLFGNSETIFLKEGRLQLGTWQGIFFCEFDGPRTRKVWVNLIKSE